MPESDLSSHYMGERGAAYAQWQLSMSRQMGPIRARIFRPYVKPTYTVLDFGCGSGEMLQSFECARRLGVEPNTAALALARANGIEGFASIDPVEAFSVDVVVSNHALEHTTRPLDELRGIRSVLKPSGRFVLAIPLDDWRTQRHYDPDDINHHLYAWTPQLLGNLLTDAGFKFDRIRLSTHAWPPGYQRLIHLPLWAFDPMCVAWAFLRRRREILAVAWP
jgi:SAM-dependent methyltransferase